jgi:methionine-rich copper-binding protein CopC
VTIEDAGNGNYRFVFDLVDDGGHKVTGEWTGKVAAQDISDAM